MDIKSLTYISDDISWLEDEATDTVIGFPTAKELLDAVIENGQAKEKAVKNMKQIAANLKEALELLDNEEDLVYYIHGVDIKTPNINKLDTIPYLEESLYEFIDYCIVSGLHYEEIVKPILENGEIVYGSTKQELNSTYSNIKCIDPKSETIYWCISEEYSFDSWILTYPLSKEEQEQARQELDNLTVEPLVKSEMYTKAYKLIIKEIIELFG